MYAQLLAAGADPQPLMVIRVLLNASDLVDLLAPPDPAYLSLPLQIDRDLMSRLAPWLVPSPPPPPGAHFEVAWCPPVTTVAALRQAVATLNPQATGSPLVVDLELAGHSLADVRRQLGLPDAPELHLNVPISDEMIEQLRALEREHQRDIAELTLEVVLGGALLADLRRSWGFPEAPTPEEVEMTLRAHRVRLH
ncbi:MAG: hypothetical protein EOM92_18045 [Gammaproteobacteria bacterium]|nr:hypothetical protein [Gammaproteobacteria bacterium]